MKLSNGTELDTIPQANGSKLLVVVPVDRPVSDSEWKEYCAIVAKSNAELVAKMKADRIAKNLASFAASKAVHVPPTCPHCGSLLSAVTFTCVRGQYCEAGR